MNPFWDPLLYFASFGALVALFLSGAAAAIWATISFLRAMFGFPRAVRELKTRPRDKRLMQAELNRLKRAGV